MMQNSLFDPPANEGALAPAASWLVDLINGQIAVILCVIAVALFGMLMLAGHLRFRRGIAVILGCFLLLSTSTLVVGLRIAADSGTSAGEAVPLAITAQKQPETPPPPANYDPYAGASLRQERPQF